MAKKTMDLLPEEPFMKCNLTGQSFEVLHLAKIHNWEQGFDLRNTGILFIRVNSFWV
jgi:hypothetical protein